jgi:cell fate regulator YaaT (PSP1 superfamily)
MARSRRSPNRSSAHSSGRRGGGRRRRGDAHRRPGGGADREAQVTELTSEPLVYVAFRGGRREAYSNVAGLAVRLGDFVMVEAERGEDLGWVVAETGPPIRRRKRQPLRKLVRMATREEAGRLATLVQEDREAFTICQERAKHFALEMKIIDAETQFDGNRITFYFTADHRVDFRELVRDLASIFRTRIELRQVGARDAARRCDGVGPCGRQLCCTTFLRDFEPVTLKMAKEQSLPLAGDVEDGQGAEPAAESGEDLRQLRAPDVLPQLRGPPLPGGDAGGAAPRLALALRGS